MPDGSHTDILSLNKSEIGRTILRLNKEIRTYGVRARFSTDFDRFRKTVEAIPDRGAVTPVFDPRHTSIGAENGFWIEGISDTGEVVHVQAIRYDDLTGTTLFDHWMEDPELYGPPGLEVQLDGCNFHTAPASHQITGTVCYHGDLWVDRSYRKFGLTPRLAILVMLTALTRFSPNYIYCFICPKNVRRGLSVQYGYLHIHPWAPQWRVKDTDEPYDDYLAWITGNELAELWSSRERDADIFAPLRKDDDGVSSVVKSVAGG